MKWKIIVIFAVMVACTGLEGKVFAETVMPDTFTAGEDTLVLNGQGTRTKFFLTMYRAALYLPEKSDRAERIVQDDRPMAIRLIMESSLITSEKMEKATLEGFEKSTGGKTEPVAEEINRFLSVFREEIKENDVYDMVYSPASGVRVVKNGDEREVINGLAFKQALFGIWLSPDPVQESLKKELLGEK
jgi:hypothetical protein